AQPDGALTDSEWFGPAMTPVAGCTSWYEYEFQNILSTSMVFNDNGNNSTQSADLSRDKEGWYVDGAWSDTPPADFATCSEGSTIACLINNPSSGTAPLTVSFDASCSTAADGTTISSYAWDFGDNSSGTGAMPSHTYTADGTYTVTLTVTDSNNGSDMITTTITVGSEPPANGITIYFEKPASWSGTINVHHWDAEPMGSDDDTMWPGEAMTDEGNGWYSFTFPNTVTATNLIFNGAGGQTENLFIDATAWYPIGCVDNSALDNGKWVFSDPTTAAQQNFDVFFEAPAGFTQPMIYYWNASGNNGWPGDMMTNVSGNLWSYSFTNIDNVCLIFNNGSGGEGNQTGNLGVTSAGGTYDWTDARWSAPAPSLAVELLELTAKSKDCTNELDWTVTNEDLSHYEIEVSADGKEFYNVDALPAQEQSRYQLPLAQRIDNRFARLKMVERDGSYSYSPVVALATDCISAVRVQPNPFRQQLRIDFLDERQTPSQIELVDMAGRTIINKTIQPIDNQQIDIQTGSLASGIYFVKIRYADRIETKKVVKR
ncbi:MAG: starch-binding protein, partial [Saprospiraceae bacterium]